MVWIAWTLGVWLDGRSNSDNAHMFRQVFNQTLFLGAEIYITFLLASQSSTTSPHTPNIHRHKAYATTAKIVAPRFQNGANIQMNALIHAGVLLRNRVVLVVQ